MKPKATIYSLSAIGVFFVLAIVVFTYNHIALIEKNIPASANEVHLHKTSAAVIDNFTRLSSQIITKAYGAEPKLLSSGQVLGDATPPIALSPEQISSIATPGVVRVFNRLTGSISMPDFKLDVKTLKIIPLNKTYTEKVDTGLTGSGFFINSDGNILTNAHVVSQDAALEEFISNAFEYYGDSVQKQLSDMNPKEESQLETDLRTKYGSNPDKATMALADDIKQVVGRYILQNASLDVQQKVAILDPGLKGKQINSMEDLDALINESIPAKIVDINKAYATSHRDVALLKIDQTQTPALILAPQAPLVSGQKIYVFGYPANASISNSDYFASTMTQGSIGAIKDINGAKVYQTDAKISPGSSGGPMFNGDGKVVAMMTYVSGGASDLGDDFAFAIPIQFGIDMLKENRTPTSDSSYTANYINGFFLAQQQLCRKANASFALVKDTNTKFGAPEQVQKYMDNCDSVIAAGNSLDSNWDIAMHSIKNLPIYVWAGSLAVLAIIVAGIYFLKKYKVRLHVPHPSQTFTSPPM